jgi:hypothetical protein
MATVIEHGIEYFDTFLSVSRISTCLTDGTYQRAHMQADALTTLSLLNPISVATTLVLSHKQRIARCVRLSVVGISKHHLSNTVHSCNIGCLFCGLLILPEHLIGTHWYLPAKWSSEQQVSPCYDIECDRSFHCALFCIFTTRVSQCPTSLRAEHPLYCSF